MVPLLWRACLDAAKRRPGADASSDEVLWWTAVSYLFAAGELAESNVSAALH